MVEWKPYRIKVPGYTKAELPYPEGLKLDTVFHVVHVPTACRILEDGKLRAGLIFDESRLNKSRIAVTWLSANTWYNGSIYGNVQFSFDWKKQVKQRTFYWVEAMPQYNPPAYRILVTDRDLSKSKHVQAYDPTASQGPLREHKGQWYWNGTRTSEFMIEADISLDLCTDMNFIEHHGEMCRPYKSECKDRGRPSYIPAGRVIAFLLGHGIHSVDHVLKKPSDWRPKSPLNDTFDRGIDGIVRALGGKKERFGGAITTPASRTAVMKGALALYGAGQLKASRELIALLKTESTFQSALREVVNGHFGTSTWEMEE